MLLIEIFFPLLKGFSGRFYALLDEGFQFNTSSLIQYVDAQTKCNSLFTAGICATSHGTFLP